MVDSIEEDFLVYLRTESESLSLDNLYQFFCCEKLDSILGSKFVSVLTEEEQILDLFYRFLKVILDKIVETIDNEVQISEFSGNSDQKIDLAMKIYNILEECITFTNTALLPMFKSQIDQLLNLEVNLKIIEELIENTLGNKINEIELKFKDLLI
jgi:hypothetical protein